MVRTVRQGGSEPLRTQMGGERGRGRGSGHVPSAHLFPLPLPNKGNSRPLLGVGVLPGSQREAREGLWMAMGRRQGEGCLPLLCPPPRVKAKVIPQPLRAGRGGRSLKTKNGSPRELGAGREAPGTHNLGLGRDSKHPPGSSILLQWPRLPSATIPLDLRAEAGRTWLRLRGKLRPKEGETES